MVSLKTMLKSCLPLNLVKQKFAKVMSTQVLFGYKWPLTCSSTETLNILAANFSGFTVRTSFKVQPQHNIIPPIHLVSYTNIQNNFLFLYSIDHIFLWHI